MSNIRPKPGFRLKTGIIDHQRAKLSWLAANTEPNRHPPAIAPTARSFRLTTKQPPQVPLIRHTNYQYPDYYYGKLPLNPTYPATYYAPNYRNAPPTYYSAYLPLSFVQPTHLPVSTMMEVISNILSILRKTVYRPNDGDDGNFNTVRNVTKQANFTNRLLSSTLLSSSLSSLLSSAGATTISGSGGEVGKGELDNVGQVKGIKGTGKVTFYSILTLKVVNLTLSAVFQVERVEKVTDSKSPEINETENATATITKTPTTAAAAASSTDDGSNLLGSLLSGRLDKVDWLGSLFGNQLPTKEEGSAMAQIFEGGIFGPAS
ncbi:unnamed protein product [Litomosoides sigmodontis]|uniref:Uncharacterized protein n=1 Tax=Litomosoides sigmodontis TaxID=42156 RepID=A0A3P6TAH0_LITSI|nr:unnamed protein product [Litomosoides sigmodontis]